MPRDRPPGIWESLKRALGGVGADSPPELPPPPPQRPNPPQLEPKTDVVSSAPPFLLPDPEASELPAAPEPPAVPVPQPPVQPPDSPRLARGLASFSRSNADREKKFAHLLHDDAPAENKKPPA